MTSPKYPTVPQVDYSFILNVNFCATSVFSISPITDISYLINSGTEYYYYSKAQFSNLACLYSVTHTLVVEKPAGTPIAQPSWVVLNTALHRIEISATAFGDMGVYTLRVNASIPQPTLADSAAVLTTSTSLVMTVGKDCFETNFTFKLIKDMSILLTQSTAQDLTFPEVKEIQYSTPGLCGARVYTFAGGLPTYLQLDTTALTLTLSTSNFADVGVHSVTFTVALASYPMVPTVTKTFTATIVCEVLSLTLTSPPSNLLIEPGVTV